MRRFAALVLVCAVALGILLALRPPIETPAERYNRELMEWYYRAAEYQSTPPYTQGPCNELARIMADAEPTGPACPIWIDIDSLLKATNETEVNSEHGGARITMEPVQSARYAVRCNHSDPTAIGTNNSAKRRSGASNSLSV